MTRMELLVGEMNAGNDSNDLKNEFIEIVHVLHRLGLIDESQILTERVCNLIIYARTINSYKFVK